MKRTYSLLFIIIVILATVVFPVPAFSQAGTVVRVDPAMSMVDQGDAFTVAIRVEDVQDLAAFDVTLHFNPDHLQVTNLVFGGFLGSGSGGNEFDNEIGLINFYHAIFSGEPANGSGILFTVYFTAKMVDVDTRVTIDKVLTELVQDETFLLIPYTAQDGSVQIGEGGTEYLNFLPLVIK